jgi:amidase
MAPSSKTEPKRPWQEIAREAQQHRDAAVANLATDFPVLLDNDKFSEPPKNSKNIPGIVLEPRDLKITESLPEELIKLLANGELSATDVTTAFLRRAALAQILVRVNSPFKILFNNLYTNIPQTNCITELLPDRALTRAKELDAYFLQHGKPIGPLHGLPISVKEMIGMKDLGLNAGYVAWWGKVATEDAHVLQTLWDAGAVFHARTTQPQSMMHLETDSNLYGVTVNPYNRKTSAGGSSGGEGALIGMRGSCLGIGSDIGGKYKLHLTQTTVSNMSR